MQNYKLERGVKKQFWLGAVPSGDESVSDCSAIKEEEDYEYLKPSQANLGNRATTTVRHLRHQ
jgi:hypothetical protein